jgi:putative ABC transport system permease protein
MRLKTGFAFALRGLLRTPLRSGLTMLGVVIGVAAVVATVSIGSGAKAQVEKLISDMDWARLYLTWMPPVRNDGSLATVGSLDERLSVDDVEAVRSGTRRIATTGILLSAVSAESRAFGRSLKSVAVGTDVVGFDLLKREVLEGAAFGDADVQRAEAVCLIPEFVAASLFPGGEAIGRSLRFGDVPLMVIGVIADRPGALDPAQAVTGDNEIYLPYTSVRRRIDRAASITIVVKPYAAEDIELAHRSATAIVEGRRGMRRGELKLTTGTESMQAYTESSRTRAQLLAAIGGISLLVGGIGIMNIMLVNVSERTREIGIRLAVGARSADVLRQFVIEAMALSLTGGGVGIVLGIGLAQLVTRINGWEMRVTPAALVAAFLCSAGIGVFFGYYPARRAALLDPVQALRAQ